MDVKILCTIAVISFFSNIIAKMVGKGAQACFHMKTFFACCVIVVISAMLFFISVVLLLLTLIWG